MSKCIDCKCYVDGSVSPDKDGACIWSEPGLKGGTVTYSKPVRKDDVCEKFCEGEASK